ncbi:MAG: farnesyl-diphosphate synthase [Desulfobacteraceae bacterium 4572_88]|nr:MAG: farnesyl-diphosphate synthase [Desulfobacteraceae bacterium 4572_88]
MRYSVMAGGKRIRPVLCMAAAEAVGGKGEEVISAACAIEMIHTYSLIHDDLPAMDDDDLRRGRPSCHVAFDEATAILAGDALLTMAFQVLSSLPCHEGTQALQLLEIIKILSVAAGCGGMIGGQMRDIASEGICLSQEALVDLHSLKTGAMIKASVLSGAVLGRGDREQIEQLGNYAKHIGLAFQVADDILNVEGDPALLGKAVGTDETRGKNTFPSLMGMAESKAFAGKLIDNALSCLDIFDSKGEPLRAIAIYIIERKK